MTSFNNLITETDTRIEDDFKELEITLFPHQRATIQKMRDYERLPYVNINATPASMCLRTRYIPRTVEENTKYYNNEINIPLGKHETLRRGAQLTCDTNIGVLSNEVGSGKTINVLGFIASNKNKYEITNSDEANYNAIYDTVEDLPEALITNILSFYKNDGSYKFLTYEKNSEFTSDVHNYLSLAQELYDTTEPINECVNYNRDINYTIKTNLIIVPHNLVNQWAEEIKEKTHLSIFVISTKRHLAKMTLDGKLNLEEIEKYDIILCNINKFKELNNFVMEDATMMWSRVFIDEADDIKITFFPHIYCEFLWIITATPSRLCRAKNGFIRRIFGYGATGEYLDAITLSCEASFVAKSKNYKQPDYIHHIIDSPYMYKKALEIISSRSVLSNIFTNDFESMKSRLPWVNLSTNQTLLFYIHRQIEIKIIYLLRRMVKICEYDITSIGAIPRLVRQNIEKYDERYRILCEYIRFYKEIFGRIRHQRLCIKCEKTTKSYLYRRESANCYDCEAGIRMNLGNVYVGTDDIFISRFYRLNGDIRFKRFENAQTSTDVFNIISTDVDVEMSKDIGPLVDNSNAKIEKLIYSLKEDIENGRRALVFSDSLNFFKVIQERLLDSEIEAYELKGNNNTIKKRVRLFNEGKVNILLLNTKYMGSGTNLQAASKIYIMNHIDSETETQVIGRANRHGRKGDLEVHYILYDIEKELFDNPNHTTKLDFDIN